MFSYFTLSNLWALCQQLLDIACIWAVVYYCLKIVKNNSRTIQIFKGVLLVILVRAAATALGLFTMETLADSIMSWGVIAVIILFQPEIRNILEKIGKTNVFSRISTLTFNERENLVEELVKACSEMSKTKTGALISMEQGHSLSDFIKTGTSMDSVVSSELLCSIFQYGTPLHDGAVIIQGVKIACAAAYFPPTTRELPTSYGARHRAAVGISEITDSITIIVSEETGNISIAEAGKLSVISQASLREFLMNIICKQQPGNAESGFELTPEKEAVKETIVAGKGKKPSVFGHYFKGKNRRKDKDAAIEQTSSVSSPIDNNKVTIQPVEQKKTNHKADFLEIEKLVQDAPLDQLFETIVTDTDKKEEKETSVTPTLVTTAQPKPKAKRGRPKKVDTTVVEEITHTNPLKRMHKKKTEINDLLDDMVEPEAIVLHYEKADDEESNKKTPKKKKEGSDS